MENEELLIEKVAGDVSPDSQDEPIQEEVVDEQPEAIAEQPETQSEIPPEVDNSAISKYFPNVEITEGNRAELEDAASKIAEYESINPKFQKILAANRELMAIMNDNDWLAELLIDLKNGVPADVALAKHIDLEALKPIEGEEPNPAYDESRKTRMSRLEEKENRKKMYDDNEAKSIEALRKFKEENKMSDEDYDTFFNALSRIISAAFDGELTSELLNSVYYILNRDADLEASKEMGKVEGRNEKILNKIQKEDEQAGDGLPDLKGVNKPKDIEPRNDDPFLDDIKRLGSKKQIL